jgi:hypothetical protein
MQSTTTGEPIMEKRKIGLVKRIPSGLVVCDQQGVQLFSICKREILGYTATGETIAVTYPNGTVVYNTKGESIGMG